jgi:ribose 1,5-bisphosphokinase
MTQKNIALKEGTFVCVVGPSGAGKDTLIGLARERLGAQPGFLFPRRLVTRPRSSFEDHAVLSEEDFERGVRDNLFALHWRAHGLGYAIDRSVLVAIAQGAAVTCNISRDSIAAAQQTFARVKVVLVTASDAAIAARLAARAREDSADIDARLTRNAECSANLAPDMTIVNSAGPAEAAEVFVGFLLSLRS